VSKLVTYDVSTLPSGWLTQAEADLLMGYVELTEGPILEVGAYRGRSTVLLARLGRVVYTVEPFEGFAKRDLSGERTEAVFKKATEALSNVELFKQRIEDWSPIHVGFAYLDGDHTYQGTVNQIKKALLCNPKYIAVHDVNDSGGGVHVKKACLDLLDPWRERAGRLAVFRVGY